MAVRRRAALMVGVGMSVVLLMALAADFGGLRLASAGTQSGGTITSVAPATGTAIYADATGGFGLYATSDNTYGVWGASNAGWGGYFTSVSGYGIRVETGGTDHYDHGAYITAQGGYGVYAVSANNMAIRGEAGNIAGIPSPLGTVGVAGLGQSRGVYGSSLNGAGVFGSSGGNYGVWGASDTYRGVTGRTSRVDNNYGFYTPDNLFSLNINMPGSIMQVMQNAGSDALEKGDVVVFAGVKRPGEPDELRNEDEDDPQARVATRLEVPIVRVAKATSASDSAAAGVVFSRFNLAILDEASELSDLESSAADGVSRADTALGSLETTPAGPVERGDYLLVVVQGAAEVKADYAAGLIEPGTPLTSGFEAGRVTRLADVVSEEEPYPVPGSVLGTALEVADPSRETFYAFISRQ